MEVARRHRGGRGGFSLPRGAQGGGGGLPRRPPALPRAEPARASTSEPQPAAPGGRWRRGRAPAPVRAAGSGLRSSGEAGSSKVPPPPGGLLGVPPSPSAEEKARQRASTLEALVAVRRLYRECLRAQVFLAEQATPMSLEPDAETYEEDLLFAIDSVAEMQYTAERLGASLRNLPEGFSAVVRMGEAGRASSAADFRRTIKKLEVDMFYRVKEELRGLPAGSRAQVEAGVLERRRMLQRLGGPGLAQAGGDASQEKLRKKKFKSRGRGQTVRESNIRLRNKVLDLTRTEKRLAKRLEPALERIRAARAENIASYASESGEYLSGLWKRLNGESAGRAELTPDDLPRLKSTEELWGEDGSVSTGGAGGYVVLQAAVTRLDRELKEEVDSREARLRKSDVLGRARLSSELRDMDERVGVLSRQLAVATLELESSMVYANLEAELLQLIIEKGSYPWRRGSSSELQLLVTQYALLDAKLADLRGALDRGEDVLLDMPELQALSEAFPDLRAALGISDSQVMPKLDVNLRSIRGSISAAGQKVVNGVLFVSRGCKLLFSDLSNGGKLFWRAATGGTLVPREVESLRRTARDLVSFVPFIIILITPITPVGHVLVFSFLQRSFPGFIPSQFTERRQEMMLRLESLRKELFDAQEEADLEWQDVRLREAEAAVEALSANEPAEGGSLVARIQDKLRAQSEILWMGGEATIDELLEEEDGGGGGGPFDFLPPNPFATPRGGPEKREPAERP